MAGTKVTHYRTTPKPVMIKGGDVLVQKLRSILSYRGNEYPLDANREYVIRTIGKVYETTQRLQKMGKQGRRAHFDNWEREANDTAAQANTR